MANVVAVTRAGKQVTEGMPTQVAHPFRSILRTLVAAALGALLGWIFRVVGIDLSEFSDALVDWLTATGWALGTALAQWLLTREWLMPALQVIGLGTGVHTEEPPEVDVTPPPEGYTPRHAG